MTTQTQTHQASRWTEQPYSADDDEDPKGHPFTDEIMEAQLPSKWKGLSIKFYDGSTDPDERLNLYKTQMNLYIANKVVWCKVFPHFIPRRCAQLVYPTPTKLSGQF